jgi:ubiquinone/menaquinone biosynthesis C-methylase UbiE
MDYIKNSVKNFYNIQAEKFSQTRNKPWPEFFYIKQEVEKLLQIREKIRVLELGCGDGRVFRYLNELFPGRIEYTGVDISEWLIKIAKENIKVNLPTSNLQQITKLPNFIVSDMLEFLEKQDQQSYDFVFAVASFQHIPTRWERLLILKNIYRILEYGGVVQMFNWSFSSWFFKKYSKNILKAFLIWIISLWTRAINDIYIPWKDKDKTYYRYYHIFFLYELKRLFKQAGFVLKEACRINKTWEKSVSWINSRNTMIVWVKSVIK